MSPVRMRNKGRLNSDPKKIPATQAQLKKISGTVFYPEY